MKRKIFIMLIIMLFLCSCGKISKNGISYESDGLSLNEQTLEQLHISDNEYIPLNFECQKAVWLTMMDYKELLDNKTEAEFTDNIVDLMDRIKNMGFNTVYVHIRPYNDAYYKSELVPPAQYCPEDFDPFEIILEKAHSLNLSVHGWINPLRCQRDSQIKALDNKYLIKNWYDDEEKNGTYICQIDNRWYLNPAYEAVREYISDCVGEIVTNYNVDGIHIDDYFYPTQEESFDETAFKDSGKSDLQQWRMNNIDLMVKEIYDKIKEVNSEMLFGISPQGNMNVDNTVQYANVQKWCSESGYCDYIVPQIYYGFKNENLPFEETVESWKSENTSEVSLVIGICTYKIGQEDIWAGSGKDEWKQDENIPSRQAEFISENNCGIAVYSIESLFDENNSDEAERLSEILKK